VRHGEGEEWSIVSNIVLRGAASETESIAENTEGWEGRIPTSAPTRPVHLSVCGKRRPARMTILRRATVAQPDPTCWYYDT
jgi:hypothetical protein